MNRRTVIAGASVALAGCASLGVPDTDAAEAKIVAGMNDIRTGEGVGELTASEPLATAARGHSADMAARDFYDHINPDGERPPDRAPCRAAENIHRGEIGQARTVPGGKLYDTATAEGVARYVVAGWRQSEGHNRLMTSGRFGAVGVGVALDDRDAFFATAMFCR